VCRSVVRLISEPNLSRFKGPELHPLTNRCRLWLTHIRLWEIFQEIGTRRLMTDLILTLNASFPDYDFGNSRPFHFIKKSAKDAMDEANGRLSELASRRHESFLEKCGTPSITSFVSPKQRFSRMCLPPSTKTH
jgi:hypothetical protein